MPCFNSLSKFLNLASHLNFYLTLSKSSANHFITIKKLSHVKEPEILPPKFLRKVEARPCSNN